MQPVRILITLAIAAIATRPASGQGTEPVAPALERNGVLVAHEGQDAFASAPGWAAFFLPGEVRFAPRATGSEIPSELGLTCESVQRGDFIAPASRGRARVEGERLVYSHRGFDEVYDVLPEGLEQSFLFATRPAGQGELVVHLRLDTDLTPTDVRPDGIVFASRGNRAVRIGAVTGIDAGGRECTGELRLMDDRLDLVLPGDFVVSAAYPLVLDPLILPASSLPSTIAADDDPDVAWDADTRRFCMVWRRDYAGSKSITLAQLFDEDGNILSPLAPLGWASTHSIEPAICSVGHSDLFVVANAETKSPGNRIRVTAMSAHDLSMRMIRLATPGLEHLDIGGDGAEGGTDVCLVYSTVNGIYSRRLTAASVDEFGPADEGPVVVAGELGDEWELWTRPRISQTAGRNGNWVVAWEHWTLFHLSNIEARVISRSGALSAIVELTFTGTARKPSVDGNGTHFLIAYVADGATRVHGQILHVLTGAVAFGWDIPLVGTPDEPAFDPQVALTSTNGEDSFTLSVRRGDWRFEYSTYTSALDSLHAPTVVADNGVSHRIASLYAADLDTPTGIFALALEQPSALAHAIAEP